MSYYFSLLYKGELMSKLAVIAIGGNSLIKDENMSPLKASIKPQRKPPCILPI